MPALTGLLVVVSALRSITWHAFAIAAAALVTATVSSVAVLVSTPSVYERQMEVDLEKTRRASSSTKPTSISGNPSSR
jgi:hypothetical protein